MAEQTSPSIFQMADDFVRASTNATVNGIGWAVTLGKIDDSMDRIAAAGDVVAYKALDFVSADLRGKESFASFNGALASEKALNAKAEIEAPITSGAGDFVGQAEAFAVGGELLGATKVLPWLGKGVGYLKNATSLGEKAATTTADMAGNAKNAATLERKTRAIENAIKAKIESGEPIESMEGAHPMLRPTPRGRGGGNRASSSGSSTPPESLDPILKPFTPEDVESLGKIKNRTEYANKLMSMGWKHDAAQLEASAQFPPVTPIKIGPLSLSNTVRGIAAASFIGAVAAALTTGKGMGDVAFLLGLPEGIVPFRNWQIEYERAQKTAETATPQQEIAAKDFAGKNIAGDMSNAHITNDGFGKAIDQGSVNDVIPPTCKIGAGSSYQMTRCDDNWVRYYGDLKDHGVARPKSVPVGLIAHQDAGGKVTWKPAPQ